jgi:hypothetical protein
MDFDPTSPLQRGVLDETRRLGALRRSSVALRRGVWRKLYARGDTLVYSRDAGAGEAALIALHDGLQPASIELDWPADLGPRPCLQEGLGQGASPAQLRPSDPLRLELPALSASIWTSACP